VIHLAPRWLTLLLTRTICLKIVIFFDSGTGPGDSWELHAGFGE
jgi:hypothetical protein